MSLDKKTLRNLFLGIVGCILLYWILHEMAKVRALIAWIWGLLLPITAGAVIAFILNVPMRAVERHLQRIQKPGLRRGVAILLTFVLVALVIAAVLWLLIPQIEATVTSIIASLPGFFARVEKFATEFLNTHPDVADWIDDYVNLETLDLSAIINQIVDLLQASLTAVLGGAFNMATRLANGAINAVIALVFGVSALARKDILARQARMLLYAFVPERRADSVLRVLRLTNSTFSSFISGQCMDACLLGCMVALAMAIFRIPYIPLVGVLVAVTALVPMVGGIVGCAISAMFIAMVSPLQALWFVILFIVVQQIDNNLVYPRVVGSSIGLPAMWVLAAVTVGGSVMGVLGMLVMIPLSSVLYCLLREVTERRLEHRSTPEEKLSPPAEAQPTIREMKRRRKSGSFHLLHRKHTAQEPPADAPGQTEAQTDETQE